MNGLTLRPATMDDTERLWHWRNDPVTRQMFRNQEEVPWESHLNWCSSVMFSTHRLLLIAECDGEPCAVVRFDAQGHNQAEVSINVAPEYRGRGVGTAALRQATQQALLRWRSVVARIKTENAASVRAFTNARYVLEAVTQNEVVMAAKKDTKLNQEVRKGDVSCRA